MLPILTLGNKEQEGPPAYSTHQVPDQECGQWEEDGAGAQRCETETPAGRAVGESRSCSQLGGPEWIKHLSSGFRLRMGADTVSHSQADVKSEGCFSKAVLRELSPFL